VLTIQNSSTVNATGTAIGSEEDAIGDLIVDNSSWDNGVGQVTLGHFGKGTLTIRNGGTFENNNTVFIGVILGGYGTATVTGIGSRFEIPLDLQVGAQGTGELYVLDRGAVIGSSAFLGTFGTSSNGFARVSGVGSEWNITNQLSVGREGIGRLEVLAGGKLTSDNGQIGETAGADGSVVVDGVGSSWTIANVQIIGNLGQGSLTVSNGGEVLVNQLLVEGNGLLTGNGTVTPSTVVQVRGEVAPGLSSGILTIDGDYTQLAPATLSIEIGGASVGAEHDQLNVTGIVNLGGDLGLSLLDLGSGTFMPSPSDMFMILTSTGLTNSFSNVANGNRLTTIDGLGSFQVNYSAGSLFNADHVVLSDFFSSVDLDNDGDVDGADFLAIQRTNSALIPQWETEFGNTGASVVTTSQAVPEPPSAILLALCVFVACHASRTNQVALPLRGGQCDNLRLSPTSRRDAATWR